jgi:L-seryl-tRNA(Ser) seleniumtransferase
MAKTDGNKVLRNLPSVDEVLLTETGRSYSAAEGQAAAASAAREAINSLRSKLGHQDETPHGRAELIGLVEAELTKRLARADRTGVRRVINATGVIVHTNLGRAPLSKEAIQALVDAAGYCTLEFDLESGTRGRRGGRVDQLVAEVSCAEDAVVVNNGAAAAFFVLTALAGGGEVVISRGELVEIGGDFRIPDVLEASGAILKEVGTTNRTKLADYARAIGPDTRMILRVHPSNFRIVGFTSTPTSEQLSDLAKERELIFYEDLGSGALVDLSHLGLGDEPVVSQVIKTGIDLVSFSGDKLLGGPQAGIIAGRKDLVERIRKHPLFRVLRADKLVYAALEATLQSYRRHTVFENIPVLQELSATAESIGERAANLLALLGPLQHMQAEIVDGISAVGGGAAPGIGISTRLISLTHPRTNAIELEARLRLGSDVPVIARIENDKVLLDLRTVTSEDEPTLLDTVRSLDR